MLYGPIIDDRDQDIFERIVVVMLVQILLSFPVRQQTD